MNGLQEGVVDTPGPQYENIDAEELSRRLNLSLSWVRNHTRRHCADPIPHVKLGAKVIFEWGSPQLNAWWNNHRKQSGNSTTSERPARQAPRSVACEVLRLGSKQEDRGARLARDILRNRAA